MSTISMQSRQNDAELFNYTSGRWIYNESLRLSERKRQFDVSELKRLAAESIGRAASDVQSFRKLAEGGFNRIFLVTMGDGYRLVARVPYPIAKPKSLLVASEVATLRYLRLQGLPVPQVYGYSTTTENASGVEHIFMEYVAGQALSDTWFDLSSSERANVMAQLVGLEARLFSLRLPASGSIFHPRDLSSSLNRVDVTISEDEAGGDRFCIGPEMTASLWYGRRVGLDTSRGPFVGSSLVLKAGAEKEIKCLMTYGKPLPQFNPVRRETYNYQAQDPEEQISNLQKYVQIVPHLDPPREDLLQPTLRHPDLQTGNIIMSQDLQIVGVVDWQHTAVLPLFLQCGIPNAFQNYGDPVSESGQEPKLPPDFDQMSEEEQEGNYGLLQRRLVHQSYIENTRALNPLHYSALATEHSVTRRRVFDHARSPWEGDNTTLKADLIQIQKSWTSLVPDPSVKCPFDFTDDEVSECRRLRAADEAADEQLQDARDMVGIGSDGWVPNEYFDEARTIADKLYTDSLGSCEDEAERERVDANWIFKDFDESEYS